MSDTIPNMPILPIPARTWALSRAGEWYAWACVNGVMYDLMVYRFMNGWTWAINNAADGSPVCNARWVTEGALYPNEADAMTACMNYFRREIGGKR